MIRLFLAALCCAALGLITRQFLVLDGLVSIWQPEAGLALALLLLGGPRYAWAVLGGFALSSTVSFGLTLQALALALGCSAGPVLGAWLLRRDAAFNVRLARLNDYLRLMAWGAGLGSLASALLGTALLVLEDLWLGAAPGLLVQWWMGSALGVMLVTPLELAW